MSAPSRLEIVAKSACSVVRGAVLCVTIRGIRRPIVRFFDCRVIRRVDTTCQHNDIINATIVAIVGILRQRITIRCLAIRSVI
jgi:hypothetical protein